jgi:LacI family transcriptional regulator, galactose operon repressor
MSTMKDLADKAGVSQATVSRVLNGSSAVAPATKAHVMEWVRKLDFQPNLSARALASKRSNLIGLILPDIQNPYFADILYHVEKIALFNGFNILLSNSDGDYNKEKEIIKSMKARQVEGLLIGFADSNSPNISEIRKKELPTVVITQSYDGLDCVGVNHFSGGEMAARELLSQNPSRFLYHGNLQDDKYKGFIHALKESGIEEDRIDTLNLGNVWYHTQLRAYNSAIEYIKEKKNTKVGVFSYSDLSAFGFIHAAQDLQKRIPQDYSIIGFDDTFMCQIIRPKLSSIAQPKEEMGRTAIKHLLARIDKKTDMKDESFLLAPRLVRRETT